MEKIFIYLFQKKRRTLAWLVCLLLTQACSVKKIVYFNDLPVDSTRLIREASSFHEPTIQRDDILSVTIQTIDPTSAAVANQSLPVQAVGASSASNVGNQLVSGYLVDKDGFIHMALLGKIPVKGLTTYQARELITELAETYYKDPTVLVRFANFKVTVLGEVTRPATYSMPNEKVSVLDALGLAGDLTIYGRRENVLLVRDQDGKKELVRLDLNDSKLFQSPYFYLKQNDVIYVEPGKAKASANNAARTQTFALLGSFVSLLVVVFTRVR
ncbi:polysaccharide biosynthesis/export family protein [Sphingobacterium suaedae]|uniref:Polysaccharide biosynthesis/export family protein n=1 Tax=Sphingobacterium suaedae TaxID=1686402 RepID=A0ABW5KM65_9SPHI